MLQATHHLTRAITRAMVYIIGNYHIYTHIIPPRNHNYMQSPSPNKHPGHFDLFWAALVVCWSVVGDAEGPCSLTELVKRKER